VFIGKYDSLVMPKKFLIDNHIVLEYDGIKVIMDNSQEFCAINEVIIQKTYELGLGNDDYCVIDIGANIGDSVLYFSSLKEVNAVYAYEPFKNSFDKALKNFALNPDLSSKIRSFNVGISNENTELYVNTPKETFGVSINHVQKGDDKIIIKEASELLAPIINAHFGKQKILLKLDCEGSEYDIVESLDKSGLLAKIDVIIGEWHFVGKRNNGYTEMNLYELQESFTRNNFLFKITNNQMFYAFRKN
jgi:FkbM family methyltransferase